jgi:hypothetical protein
LPQLVAARSDNDGASLVIVGEVVRLRDRLKWFAPMSSRGGSQPGDR